MTSTSSVRGSSRTCSCARARRASSLADQIAPTSGHVLLISSRLGPGREEALRHATGAGARLDVTDDLGAATRGGFRYQAVVLDGVFPGLAAATPQLEAYVCAGGTLIAIGAVPQEPGVACDLLGARALPPVTRAEIIVRRSHEHGLLARLAHEFPVVDTFQPLDALSGAEALLEVSWALALRPVAVERRLGDGWIVATTLGATTGALQSPGLVRILRRAVRSARATPGAAPLRAAIVGYGPTSGMGYVHGTGITRTPGLQLVAVCDPSADRRAAAVAEFDGIATYATPDDLADARDVDLVFLATPPATHAALTRQLLESGKHVACEKPLCLTTREADELIGTARRQGVVLTVNQNRRWDPDFLAVRRAVDEGLLGDLFNVETFVGDFAHPCRYWHSDAGVSGGATYDWGSHYIDWTLQLMGGPPSSVTASAHKRVWHDVTNADQVRVHMRWDDGREAEFMASDLAGLPKPKFYVQGTSGTLEGRYRPLTFESIQPGVGYVLEQPHVAEAPADILLARYESGHGRTVSQLPTPPREPFAFHRNLADHLLLGDELAVTPESVRSVVAVLEAAEASARREGTSIRLDRP